MDGRQEEDIIDELNVLLKELTPFILDSPQLNQMFDYYGTFDKVFPIMCGYLLPTVKNLQFMLDDLKKASHTEYYLNENDHQQLKVLEHNLTRLDMFIRKLNKIISDKSQLEEEQTMIDNEKIKSINHLLESIRNLKINSLADKNSHHYMLMSIHILDRDLNDIRKQYKKSHGEILNEMIVTIRETVTLITKLFPHENHLSNELKQILKNDIYLPETLITISEHNNKNTELLSLINKILFYNHFWDKKLKIHQELNALLPLMKNNNLPTDKKITEIKGMAISFLQSTKDKDPDIQHLCEAIVFFDFEKLHGIDHLTQAYKYKYLTEMLNIPLYLSMDNLLLKLTSGQYSVTHANFINSYIMNLITHFEVYSRDATTINENLMNEKISIAQHTIHLLVELMKSDDRVELKALKTYQLLLHGYQKNISLFNQRNSDQLGDILQMSIEFMEKYYSKCCNENAKTNYYSYHLER